MKKILLVVIALLSINTFAQQHDEFLTELYDQLHDSPMQQKIREIAPMPYGVVFLPWAGCTEEDMRHHFRMMKELGFTNLKQTMPSPEWTRYEIKKIALEEGIIPFWYGEGGWEAITSELLETLNISSDLSIAEIREHPAMLDYQYKVLERHLLDWRQPVFPDAVRYRHHADAYLRPADEELFRQWVKEKYHTIEDLARAWNQYEVGITDSPYQSWEDFDNDTFVTTIPGSDEIVPSVGREYGKVRDILRFKADMRNEDLRKYLVPRHPEQPVRAGGEMGLFLPFASRATDMEGIADVMTDRGSFYPSIHLAWHFEETDYEVTRNIYMQSSITVDWFKGGWASTWESTGGPQQFSGGKGWDRKGQEGTPGYTVDEGTITQLLLSYMAGGMRGVGLWAWNYRRAGWESGEYALLNRQNEPGPRAIKAGKIAKAANKYRDELWQTRKEPTVGVLVNWDNEAIWAAIAGPGRTHFKHYPIQARIGISRALINGNVPWEHVTYDDIKNGLAPRYKVIYMPAQAAINRDLLPLLEEYVKQGGRLVIDAPGAWWDERGLVLDTGKGSPFANIFGASIADFQYSNNVPERLMEHTLSGFLLDINPHTANILERYESGKIAVTENKLGKGSAVILSPDVSFSMKRQGNDFMENWSLNHILGDIPLNYTCEGAIVYRITAPEADHYFFMNDDEAKTVNFTTKYTYKSVSDPVTGEVLPLGEPVSLERFNGRWLRFEK